MSKMLIIGGSGFLGSHIADELSSQGHEVTIYDNYKSNWLKSNQKMIVDDLLDRNSVTKAAKNKDFIFHFGAIADIQKSIENPFDTININILGTAIAIEAAIKNKIKKFIFSSSLYVNSNAGSFYRSSKIACENIIEDYHKKFNLKYTILRYGSLYGPRSQNWNGIKKYLIEIIKTKKLVRLGSGDERREYIHVLDAAKMSSQVIQNKYDNKTLIISGNQVLSAKELGKMMFEIANIKENLVFKNRPSDDDHYTLTPNRYIDKERFSKKIIPDEHIDIGEGLLQLVREIKEDI